MDILLTIYTGLITVAAVVMSFKIRKDQRSLVYLKELLPPPSSRSLMRSLEKGECSIQDLEEAGIKIHRPLPPSKEEIEKTLHWCNTLMEFCRWVLQDLDRLLGLEWRTRALEILCTAPEMIDLEESAYRIFRDDVRRRSCTKGPTHWPSDVSETAKIKRRNWQNTMDLFELARKIRRSISKDLVIG